ncbi:MAG: hypothetical protein KKC14_09870 [Alphaproteobacteria bacterium]|nr:hypothetical protein [Alphaproteobacteria bacterium]
MSDRTPQALDLKTATSHGAAFSAAVSSIPLLSMREWGCSAVPIPHIGFEGVDGLVNFEERSLSARHLPLGQDWINR